jgi:hypothetical protein
LANDRNDIYYKSNPGHTKYVIKSDREQKRKEKKTSHANSDPFRMYNSVIGHLILCFDSVA